MCGIDSNPSKPHQIIQRNIVGGATALIDVQLFKAFPKIPDGVEYHDHWYAVLSSLLGKITHIKRPLYYYSLHEQNVAGAGEYIGLFNLKPHQLKQSILKTLVYKWSYVHSIYKALVLNNIKVPFRLKLLLKYKFDLGFFNILLSIPSLFNDKALFRSSLSIGLGKFLSIFR